MQKLLAAVVKEILLLTRDLPGLAILFVMPVLLIIVVTLAQEKAMTNQVSKTSLLVLDQASTPLSESIKENIRQSGFFDIKQPDKDTEHRLETLKFLIEKGDFQIGLVLCPQDTALQIWVDPTLQVTYRLNLVHSLTYLIRAAQSKASLESMLLLLTGQNKSLSKQVMHSAAEKLPGISEHFALKSKSGINPTPIQNNVPGFILFAMFFIVIPLSGSMINEKNEGTFQRLGTLPVPFVSLLSAKVLVYLAVCLIQFSIMLMVGLWIFPACFGLPALELGSRYGGILLATISAALAAVGFGIMVGSFSDTHNQAAMFGSVMVVLLGTISGTFLPIHIMPRAIQWISHLSPVRWGIDNYLTLFIREGSISDILPNIMLLLLFFGFAMMLSIATFAKRK